jgi:glycosyltransferase involved in cell wall biosynthesis
MNAHGQTICLNMIVKNEAHVIRRCLDSVLPLIDTWIIVDTGSTDGTQDVIREHLRGLPGELVERPWVNFAANRSEALQLARGRADYVFVLDADETVELDPGFVLPALTADSYDVEMLYGAYSYVRKQLVRNALPWKYSGVLHEYIHCEEAVTSAPLHGIRTVPRHDGARARDPQTYRRDALLLEQALLEEPNNARYVFYLAQSYRDAGDLELALRHYKRRVEMGGWPEEVWFSLYQIAQLEERLEKPWPEVMQQYLAAYQYRSDRVGPLFRIALHYQKVREHAVSHLFLSRAMAIPYPAGNRLFVEKPIYDYMLPVEYAVASYYIGDHQAAIETNNALLRGGKLPPQSVDQVIRNRRYSLDALHVKQPGAAVATMRLLVPMTDPGAELDETLESLLRQTDARFDVTFIDNGSSVDVLPRLPRDPRFTLLRREPRTQSDEAAARHIAARCSADDVVIVVPPGSRFIDSDTLTKIRARFDDANCQLLYGNYRLPTGRFGAAEPATGAADFEKRGAAMAGGSIVAFRPRVALEAGSIDREALWESAGFAQTCFSDEPLTVIGESTTIYGSDDRARTSRALTPVLASLPELPVISCLMITRDRLALAKRAISCFADQTYPNRELVIVSEGDAWYRNALERHVAAVGIERVRFVYAPTDTPLGALRNMSIDAAAGEILCQWDDDDCSLPDRLMVQAEQLFRDGARACFLTDHLQFLEHDRVLLWIDWTLDGTVTGERQLFPGTVMMFKDARFRYPEEGPYCRRGEDSVLIHNLYRNVPVTKLSGMGHLYLYQFHGRNTFSKEHHYQITACTASNDVLHTHADKIRHAAKYYAIPKPILVVGKNGPAFAVD